MDPSSVPEMSETDMITENVAIAIQMLGPGDLPIDVSFLIGMGFAFILYGIYTSIFSLVWITRKKKSIKNPIVTGVTIALFILVTVLMTVLFAQLYNAFIVYRDTMGPAVWLANFPHPTQKYLTPLRNWLSLFTGAIAQCLIVWRVMVIWRGFKWVMVAPACLLFCCFGLSFSAAILTHVASRPPITESLLNAYNGVQLAAQASNLATNVISTGLIVGRLWWMARNISSTSPTKELTNRIIGTIIESGLLFTLSSITRVTLNSMVYKATFLADPIGIVIDGLAPTLIILRLNIAASSSHNTSSAHTAFLKTSNSGLRGGRVNTNLGAHTVSTKIAFAHPQSQIASGDETESRRTIDCGKPPGMGTVHSIDEEKGYVKSSGVMELSTLKGDNDSPTFAPILDDHPYHHMV